MSTGTTNAILFETSGGAAAHQILVGHYEAATGAYLDIQSGVPTLIQEPGSVAASSGITLVPGPGTHAVAWAITGGNIRWSIDGQSSATTPGAAVAVTAVSGTYAAPSASASLVVGAGVGGASAFTLGGLVEWKTYSRALSDYDLATIAAMGQDNKWAGLVAAPSGETGVTFDAKATQWSGSGNWTTAGSAPATLVPSGTPTLALPSQRCLLLSDVQAYMADSHVQGAFPTGPVLAPIPYGRLGFTTTDQTIYYDLNDSVCMSNEVRKNGAVLQIAGGNDPPSCSTGTAFGTFASPTTNPLRRTIPVPTGGGSNAIEIVDSYSAAILSGQSPPVPVAHTQLTEVCFTPTGLTSVTAPSADLAQVQLHIYGDSITCGFASDAAVQNGWTNLLRDHYRTAINPSVHVDIDCFNGRSLWRDIAQIYGSHVGSTGACIGAVDSGATAAEFARLAQEQVTMVSQVQPGGERIVILAIGVNDFNSNQIDTPCFASYYSEFMMAMYALDPGLKYLVLSPISHIADAGPADGNFSLNQFRIQQQNACTALNTFAGAQVCWYQDGSGLVTDGELAGGGGIHPDNAGMSAIYSQVLTDLHVIDSRL